jgi:hypothetical protein
MDNPTPPRRRRRHPARGARQNTAVFSAAAFIGLGAGIAVQQSAVGTANPVITVPVTTVPMTTVPADPVQEYDDDAPITVTPTTATPPPAATAASQPAPQRVAAPPQAKTGGS